MQLRLFPFLSKGEKLQCLKRQMRPIQRMGERPKNARIPKLQDDDGIERTQKQVNVLRPTNVSRREMRPTHGKEREHWRIPTEVCMRKLHVRGERNIPHSLSLPRRPCRQEVCPWRSLFFLFFPTVLLSDSGDFPYVLRRGFCFFCCCYSMALERIADRRHKTTKDSPYIILMGEPGVVDARLASFLLTFPHLKRGVTKTRFLSRLGQTDAANESCVPIVTTHLVALPAASLHLSFLTMKTQVTSSKANAESKVRS